jgi:transposase
MREIVNAVLYQTRTGCQWRYLSKDLLPYGVCYYFALWRKDSADKQIHDLLRMQVREQAGRAEDPIAVVLDSQSVVLRPAYRRPRPVWMWARRPGP